MPFIVLLLLSMLKISAYLSIYQLRRIDLQCRVLVMDEWIANVQAPRDICLKTSTLRC